MHNFERVAEIQHLLELDPDKLDGPEGLEPAPEVLAARAANIKAVFGEILPPSEGQTCVICPPQLWKSAALFYDRVWMPPNVPEQQKLKDTAFYTATEIEVLAAWQGILDPHEKHEPGCHCINMREYLIKQMSDGIQKVSGIESTCLYDSQAAMNEEFKEGSLDALTLVVSNIEGICANKLEWPQVTDIRKDKESIQKLRRFKWWMNTDMQGRELSEISDKIAVGISDYEFALKKHGVETQSATWASIFDFRTILASVGIGKLLTPLGDLISVTAPILVNIGTGIFEFRRRKVMGEEVKRKNPELAYVMELKNRCRT